MTLEQLRAAIDGVDDRIGRAPEAIRDARGEHRVVAPSRGTPPAVLGWGGSAAERLAEAARLHAGTALDNAQQRNVVAPPRGLVEQHTQKERRRATRGFGVRLEGRPRGTGIVRTGPRQARGIRQRTRKIRPMRLAGDRSRATPRRAHRAGTVGDLGVPAGVLRRDRR